MDQAELIRLEAKNELSRRFFYDYCVNRYPKVYQPDRAYLEDVCNRLQAFMEQNAKRFLVINMPPRHVKSFTGKNFTEWLFGQDPTRKAMTGSYNETLSTTFARQVRNTIEERKADGSTVVYRDIFPKTAVKYGEASASMWSLEGMNEKSYLATSPGGTATGFGANVMFIDDIIKNAEEAYNEAFLDKIWEWFTNTMMQRLEGDDWKVIVIMTRWATNDLAGRILERFGDQVEHINYKAVQDDGSMLCDSILTKKDYLLKTQEMSAEIVEANYNQSPIDVEGRLYGEFPTWDELPKGDHIVKNYTDTADTGKDALCSIDYVAINGDAYILDMVVSEEAMEVTEPAVAKLLTRDNVNQAEIESNNGGRGFARNVERILREELDNKRTVVTWVPQTANKEARILSSSAWVNRHVFMPQNWKSKYPLAKKQLSKYQRKGENQPDDVPDVLAAIYERVSAPDMSKNAPSTGGSYEYPTTQRTRVVLRSKYKRTQL